MQPTPRRALRLTAVLASACALTGCAAFASTTATVSPTVSPGPTSTFLQTPTVPTSSAPGLSNTGTNLPVVVASLVKYGQWLIANPDPSLVDRIAVPGCAAANDLIHETQSLVDQGAYVTTALPVVTGMQYPSPAASAGAASLGDQTMLDMQVSRPAEALTQRTTAKKTQIISYLPELRSTTVRVSLIRGADKKWRFCEVTTPLDGSRADSITVLL
ncbi:hypothetical protein ACWT_5352 [Actinoplanes sp. SE50]|uniref:hypothetical protein n=1 Tax=unclassified Actinoplanes TaxID=2626549 RepID=UPI00023EC318|nr:MULTISPECIES: hypothetical protein [unclassified Actinoplanes]AEV86370.1 hypothetical protein ACPL_5483 [Actinoplanes sp. SE50/110]ATO84767.1 hypothetical protein ACWT_5352 [Actinoplanes sp. SE50]SLM02177.1 hypothetical protein ACSP50_5415 [Actinoplanes sp. SE50/110]